MPSNVGYDPRMRFWMPVRALFLVASFCVSAFGQANGVPPSVTSFGFGGQPRFNGHAPGVTSLGPQGPTPVHTPHQPQFHQPGTHHSGNHHHQNQNQGYVYPYYVPYYVPYYPDEQASADVPEDPSQYQGGPTIFDRRGAGELAPNDYQAEKSVPAPKPPLSSSPIASPAVATTSVGPPPEPPRTPEPVVIAQPSTVLIFKDGHKQEVSNYAIVGSNIFDLTPGHRLKIALSDLDLDATQKANDEQGVDFKLPQTPGD